MLSKLVEFRGAYQNRGISFEIISALVIVFSAILLGVKTTTMGERYSSALVYADYFISIFFIIEITLRYYFSSNKRVFISNGWNIFDIVIVIISVLPVPEGEIAVLGRLVRIFRVLRIVSAVPKLKELIDSLVFSLPKLGYIALLMFIIFYIFAVVGSTYFSEINPDLWGDVSISMLTLFRIMTFEDWTDVMYETMEVYSLSWLYYISFIGLTTFSFLNLVISVMVDEFSDVSISETEIYNKELIQELKNIRTDIEKLKY